MATPVLGIFTVGLEVYKAIMGDWLKLIELMTPEQRAAYIDIVIERERWWQEHVWRKLGDLLDGPEEPPT